MAHFEISKKEALRNGKLNVRSIFGKLFILGLLLFVGGTFCIVYGVINNQMATLLIGVVAILALIAYIYTYHTGIKKINENIEKIYSYIPNGVESSEIEHVGDVFKYRNISLNSSLDINELDIEKIQKYHSIYLMKLYNRQVLTFPVTDETTELFKDFISKK